MTVSSELAEGSPRKDACTVLVLYEDPATRQRGLAACDYLVQNFWTEIEFDFHWWRTDFLADPSLAAAAAEKAAQANLIFWCSLEPREPSPMLKAWFESWIESRREREGMLVNLVLSAGDATPYPPHGGEWFLRDISRRADLDYLGASPPPGVSLLPASALDAEQRANLMSGLLDDLLHESPRPPHFGIND